MCYYGYAIEFVQRVADSLVCSDFSPPDQMHRDRQYKQKAQCGENEL